MYRLRVSEPTLDGRELEYVTNALTKNELTWHGEYVKRFETDFAKFIGVKHAISCCNGTAALHLALLSCGVMPGDTVIMPALTYVATANAATYCGAKTIFCDVDPLTWCLSAYDVERQLADGLSFPGRVFILPVHLYGVMADMERLQTVARAYGATIIEDAAEAHGACNPTRRAGSLGRAGVFSFYGNKIITTGEGGMVTTDDDAVNHFCRLYRGQGVSSKGSYDHTVVGYNYRMTNLQAALGVAQLEKVTDYLTVRHNVVKWYQENLPVYVERQTRRTGDVGWMYSVLVPRGVNRDDVRMKLTRAGIETRSVFTLMTDLPMYAGQKTPFRSAEISSRGINLPTHGRMTYDDVRFVVTQLLKALER